MSAINIGQIRSDPLFSEPMRVETVATPCYWLYVVTSCKSEPCLQEPIKNPARFPWHEVRKVDHCYLSVDALTEPMQVKERPEAYGDGYPWGELSIVRWRFNGIQRYNGQKL